jgi:hypothetical protein
MAKNGASLSEIAAKFGTNVETIERKAKSRDSDQATFKGIART